MSTSQAVDEPATFLGQPCRYAENLVSATLDGRETVVLKINDHEFRLDIDAATKLSRQIAALR